MLLDQANTTATIQAGAEFAYDDQSIFYPNGAIRTGAAGCKVTCNGAIHLTWTSDGRQLSISMSARSQDSERALQFAKQDIRRVYRGAGVEVRA